MAPQVAGPLRLTSGDLVDLGIVDEVIGETKADLRAAVRSALATAVPGDRLRRADAVSQASGSATDSPAAHGGGGGDGSSKICPA